MTRSWLAQVEQIIKLIRIRVHNCSIRRWCCFQINQSTAHTHGCVYDRMYRNKIHDIFSFLWARSSFFFFAFLVCFTLEIPLKRRERPLRIINVYLPKSHLTFRSSRKSWFTTHFYVFRSLLQVFFFLFKFHFHTTFLFLLWYSFFFLSFVWVWVISG